MSLRFREYGFTYAGSDRPAIHDVTLDVPAGRVASVIAPQGAGKTTLLRAAAGLLGGIYEGTPTGDVSRPSSRQPGAFFDGYVQVTLAVETVGEEIALPLHSPGSRPGAGLSAAERYARVARVARELRIEHLLDREVTALSGGEEKLVGIAAALAADADLHILDEPFEQLDLVHHAAVIRAAKRRARAGGMVLIATGSIDTAINVCDLAVVYDGDRWRTIDRPSYGDVACIAGLEGSALARMLAGRHDLSEVRRFRDGAIRLS